MGNVVPYTPAMGVPNDGNHAMTRRDPFTESFHQLMQSSGMTLVQLQAELAARDVNVALSTLSYWRSGGRRPEGRRSVAIVAEIERVLGVDPTTLTGRLPSEQRALIERDVTDIPDHGEEFEYLLQQLGDVRPDDLTEISTHITLDVDRRGDIRGFSFRTLWRAVRNGVSYAPLVLAIPPVSEPPRLLSTIGCTPGPLARGRTPSAFGIPLVLDGKPAEGDYTLTEIRGEFSPGFSVSQMDHSLTTGITELLMWVRFAPDRLPSRAESWMRREGVLSSEPVRLDGVSLFARHSHVPGGQAGIRWHW